MSTPKGESSQNCAVGERNRLTAQNAVATITPLRKTQKAAPRNRPISYSLMGGI